MLADNAPPHPPARPAPPAPSPSAVRVHGIQQFIHTYNRIKGRTNDVLKWGDEVRACMCRAGGGGGRGG